MPSEFDEILAAGMQALVESPLGEPITYTPAGGAPISLRAVVEYLSAQENTSPGSFPSLYFSKASLTIAAQQGDYVTIAGKVFQVYRVDLDSSGFYTLSLNA